MNLWGMGISQHIHGTTMRAASLPGIDDRTDRQPGTGLHPLRGQNNVQGAI